MNKKILLSFALLLVFAGAVSFMNFNRTAEAAFIGSSLPITTDGTSITVYNGTVNGAINASDFIYVSDLRLKENIVPLASSLEKINSLQGVSFDWKRGGETNIGFIAQDVEKVIPELVVTDANTGFKAVKYGNMVALLVEAVKAQQIQIEALQAQVVELSK